MDENVSLVFSWDPRVKTWVKERGPDDAAPPPVAPIDDGAVQTYFLDPTNGKWTGTILGLRARVISVEQGDAYRAPLMSGLAIPHGRDRGAAAGPRPSSRAPLFAALATVLVVVGAGAFAANAVFGGSSPVATDAPMSATPSGAGAAAAATSPSPLASQSPVASSEATPAATSAPTQAPVRTAAPPPPAPRTIRLTVKLPNGTQVVYSGPSAVPQNTTFQGIFSVVLPSGQGGNESLTVYLGNPNGVNTSVLGTKPDANGNYVLTLRSFVPKGDETLSVVYGTTPGIYQLGSITVQ